MSLFLEKSISDVAIEIWQIIGKICLENIEPAVAVVVTRRYAHPRLITSIGTRADSGLQAFFSKRSVPIVPEQIALIAVVSDVNVRPAVIIEVSSQHAEAVTRWGLADTAFVRHVLECAVAIVVKEQVSGFG